MIITTRVLRGGSWFIDARNVRCTFRLAYVPGFRYAGIGFRPVAKAIPPDTTRVLRGGSWLAVARFVRCANRYAYVPGYRDESCGFRPVAKAKS